MPRYYVKLKDTDAVVHVNADENPENGANIGYARSNIVFKRGSREVGRFQASEVVAWWCNDDASEDSSEE